MVSLDVTSMYSSLRSRSSESPHELSDPRRFPSADATNARQLAFLGCHDTFDRTKFGEQAACQRRTYSRQALEHLELALIGTVWLTVVQFQTTVAGAELLREKAQKPERVFRIAGPDHWQAPHHGQGCDRALERMWMDVRHVRRPRAFQENERTIRTSREPR